tara:strand:+ start:804 stop:995 length:192 start_codon:yes stop_codon:yes gene_type:complete
MEVNSVNAFYEAAVNRMAVQINELEALIKRKLTVDEKDNLHEFYSNLPNSLKEKFEDRVGPLV